MRAVVVILLVFGVSIGVRSCQGPDLQGWCIDFNANSATWDGASRDHIVRDTSRLAGSAPEELRDTADALATAALQDDTLGVTAHVFALTQQCSTAS